MTVLRRDPGARAVRTRRGPVGSTWTRALAGPRRWTHNSNPGVSSLPSRVCAVLITLPSLCRRRRGGPTNVRRPSLTPGSARAGSGRGVRKSGIQTTHDAVSSIQML